jgi:hypothetical protein
MRQTAASPEEAAAIAAAIEQFLRDTAPSPSPDRRETAGEWQRTASLEAIGVRAADPWGDAQPWGR